MTWLRRCLFCSAGGSARVLPVLMASLLLLASGGGVASASSARGPSPPPVASIGDLVGRAREMDGMQVRIVGEAVGDLMMRGDHAWLNVLDASGAAIGVYLPKAEGFKVTVMGKYSQKGDTVDLIGIFHNACPSHDGEPDVHAESLVRIHEGGLVPRPVSATRVVLSCVFLGLTLLMGIALRRRRPSHQGIPGAEVE